MNHRARKNALGDWFREISALLAVFPWLDMALERKSMDWKFVIQAGFAALIFLVIGLLLMEDE